MLRSLHAVSAVAAACGYAVTAGSFLAGPHHELGVALLKCQVSVQRCGGKVFALAAGRHVSPGAGVLSSE